MPKELLAPIPEPDAVLVEVMVPRAVPRERA